jgi:hypothetical protein
MADAEPAHAPDVAPGPPPNAPLAEPMPEAAADPPGPAWDDLVTELELKPHGLAPLKQRMNHKG